MSLWGGRFSGEIDQFFAAYNASFRFDRRLLGADLSASAVHARALGRAGVLSTAEVTAIVDGLAEIGLAASTPGYLDQPEFAGTEDVHSFIEARLVERIGTAGYKLHTGRSRNDQVAVATRLFLREEIDQLQARLRETRSALLDLADRYPDAAIPATPISKRPSPSSLPTISWPISRC